MHRVWDERLSRVWGHTLGKYKWVREKSILVAGLTLGRFTVGSPRRREKRSSLSRIPRHSPILLAIAILFLIRGQASSNAQGGRASSCTSNSASHLSFASIIFTFVLPIGMRIMLDRRRQAGIPLESLYCYSSFSCGYYHSLGAVKNKPD